MERNSVSSQELLLEDVRSGQSIVTQLGPHSTTHINVYLWKKGNSCMKQSNLYMLYKVKLKFLSSEQVHLWKNNVKIK